ncbi:hypothetical protein GQR58_027299 [Nymphon striatum]|nr:hypothetical protein GQR58_027299 [Nymphon striatum]
MLIFTELKKRNPEWTFKLEPRPAANVANYKPDLCDIPIVNHMLFSVAQRTIAYSVVWSNTKKMASVNYKVPPVFTAQKPYSRWIDEIKAWKALTDLDKRKMGVAIALSLPEEGLSSIRDKVFSDLILDELNSDDGVDSLIEFMDKIFKMDELSEAYEFYTEFDRFRRSKVGSMEDGLRNGV